MRLWYFCIRRPVASISLRRRWPSPSTTCTCFGTYCRWKRSYYTILKPGSQGLLAWQLWMLYSDLMLVRIEIPQIMFERIIREIRSHIGAPVTSVTTAYMLIVIRPVFISDQSTTNTPLLVLDLVFDHYHIMEYAWSVGVLTYLYWQLGEASREDISTIDGCRSLWQYWIWTHFPQLALTTSDVHNVLKIFHLARIGVERT